MGKSLQHSAETWNFLVVIISYSAAASELRRAGLSRADLCSLLGNFTWGAEAGLGIRHTWVLAPAVSEDHGQIPEGVWASMSSVPVCQVLPGVPSTSKYIVPCHPHNQRSKCFSPPALAEKTGGAACCARAHTGGRTGLQCLLWASQAHWEDESDPSWGPWVWEHGLSRQLSPGLTCPTCSIDSGSSPE